MAIDFTSPVKTANYDTGILGVIRNNQVAIASFLDGVAITAGNTAGLKRYNASSALFEKSDGAAWTEMPLSYLKLAGGALTGGDLKLFRDGSAALHAVTLQQLNAGLGSKAPTSALAAYAPLAGAAFTGNLSTNGSFGASGAIYSANSISTPGGVASGGGFLNQNGTGSSLIYNDANVNDVTFRVGPSSAYRYAQLDATGNFSLMTGSVGGTFVGGALSVTGGINGGDFTATRGDGSGVIFLGGPSHYLFFDGTNYYLNAGALTVSGLLYGRGGGTGLGQITSQNGGSPSGGALGDICGIW